MRTHAGRSTLVGQEAIAMTTTTAHRPHAGLLAWLRQHGVDHEVHEHLAAYTAISTARSEGIDARSFAKVVGVATDDDRCALVVLDAPDRVDLHKARLVFGSSVRLLTEPELAERTPGCEHGAMPAVGSLFGLPTYADYAIRDQSEISFNAGTHRATVRVDRAAWEEATDVHYADLAETTDDRPAWFRS